MNNQIDEAVRILKQGGIVIFPTDTAFGIGCRIDDEAAIKRLFNIRKRPYSQATPVLVNNIDMVKKYVLEFPRDAELLASQYWPGALTIVMKAKETVPNLVNGGGDTVGIRIPNHDIALKLIENVGVGILGPSANFHGAKTPYNFEDLDSELVSLVDLVVNGECKLKQTSTVIDCSVKPWQIIREGAVKLNL